MGRKEDGDDWPGLGLLLYFGGVGLFYGLAVGLEDLLGEDQLVFVYLEVEVPN